MLRRFKFSACDEIGDKKNELHSFELDFSPNNDYDFNTHLVKDGVLSKAVVLDGCEIEANRVFEIVGDIKHVFGLNCYIHFMSEWRVCEHNTNVTTSFYYEFVVNENVCAIEYKKSNRAFTDLFYFRVSVNGAPYQDFDVNGQYLDLGALKKLHDFGVYNVVDLMRYESGHYDVRICKNQRRSIVLIDEYKGGPYREMVRYINDMVNADPNVQIIMSTYITDLISNDFLRPDCYQVYNNNKFSKLCNLVGNKKLRRAHNLQKIYKGLMCDGI